MTVTINTDGTTTITNITVAELAEMQAAKTIAPVVIPSTPVTPITMEPITLESTKKTINAGVDWTIDSVVAPAADFLANDAVRVASRGVETVGGWLADFGSWLGNGAKAAADARVRG